MLPFLAMVLLGAPPAFGVELQNATVVEPIAFSTDERRVALRVFHGAQSDQGEPCPGYLDANGQPFHGALSLVVLERGKAVASFPVQDSDAREGPHCTPRVEARLRLESARSSLMELGFGFQSGAMPQALAPTRASTPHQATTRQVKVGADEHPVETTTWTDTWSASVGKDLTLRLIIDVTREHAGTVKVEGKARLVLEHGGKSRVLRTLRLEPGGEVAYAPQPFMVSATGRTALVIVSAVSTTSHGWSAQTQFVETVDLPAK